jgi:DNA replication protein DnaC
MSAAPQIRTALTENLKELHLPRCASASSRPRTKRRKRLSATSNTLLQLTERECESRRRNRIAALLRESGLPREKTMANFDLKRLPVKAGRQLKALVDGSFLDRKENLLLFGNPGAGKSHLLCALAHELIAQGRRMKYTSCAMLVQDLLVAKRDLRLSKEIKKLARHDGLIIDEMGYVQQSREEMEVLFTLLSERYERGSVLLTSNLPFSKWEGIFKDPMTTAAAIDRLVHHSVIVELNIPSYRMEEAKKNRDPRTGKQRSQLTGAETGVRCCWQALRSAPSGLRSGPASNNAISAWKGEKSSNNYRELWLSLTGKSPRGGTSVSRYGVSSFTLWRIIFTLCVDPHRVQLYGVSTSALWGTTSGLCANPQISPTPRATFQLQPEVLPQLMQR